MRIHHLNCGTMCPLGGHLMDGVTEGVGPARLVCHCLLVETGGGLVLVDTGFGHRDAADPGGRLSGVFRGLLRPRLDPAETAATQIERLGFRREDVRHIVLTHLDFDHAGGIEDFPWATVHVLEDELVAAKRRDGYVAKGRYRPMQWDEGVRWSTYRRGEGEGWFGFECVRDLAGLPPDILLVPLIGHTWGHCGVAVRGPDGWLLNAGDAYFYREEMNPAAPTCSPGLAAYQKLMEVDSRSRLWNQRRLRDLVRTHGADVRVFSAHDRREFGAAKELEVLSRAPSGGLSMDYGDEEVVRPFRGARRARDEGRGGGAGLGDGPAGGGA